MMRLDWNAFTITTSSPLGKTEQIYWSSINKIEVSRVLDSPVQECNIFFFLKGQHRITVPIYLLDNIEALYEFSSGIREALGDNCHSDWITPLKMTDSADPIIIWSREDEQKNKSSLFQTLYVNNWEEAKYIGRFERGRVFRGQSRVNWMLSTSIERAFERAHSTGGMAREAMLASCESDMLYEFKRKALLYEKNLPAEHNLLEWLSLMQHYGCPTRLLDFTKSFYVAAFFAIANASQDDDIAIWAISRHGLAHCSKRHLGNVAREKDLQKNRDAVKVFNDVASNGLQFTGLMILEPEQLNNRISAQQGLFVVPLDIRKTFEENLISLTGEAGISNSLDQLLTANTKQYQPGKSGAVSLDLDAMVVKIVIPRVEIHEIRRDLKRMNVTYETLFPGLEGYARSLENLLYHQ